MWVSHRVLTVVARFASRDPTRGTLQGVCVDRIDGKSRVIATNGSAAIVVSWLDEVGESNLPGPGRIWGVLQIQSLLDALKATKHVAGDKLWLDEGVERDTVTLRAANEPAHSVTCWPSPSFPSIQDVLRRPKRGSAKGGSIKMQADPVLLLEIFRALVEVTGAKDNARPGIVVDMPLDTSEKCGPLIFRACKKTPWMEVEAALMPTRSDHC